MEAPQQIYNQSPTHFALRLYLRPETEVDGAYIADLSERFLSTLLFPSTRPTSLHTKRHGEGVRLNMGDFTSSRWRVSLKKILKGEYAVVTINAETPDFPDQRISFSSHVNPIGGHEFLTAGTIEVNCSIPYLRHLAASTEKIEALVQLTIQAWNGVLVAPAYGYGNVARILARPIFDPRVRRPPGAPLPWEYIKPPDRRAHAVPVAYVGNDIEGNLASLYCKDLGIKGAYWANLLSPAQVALAGGDNVLRGKLDGMRVERLNNDGLLIVATDSPLPRDTGDTRERFLRLDDALQPAFLSREATPAVKRGMLGYFFRERPKMR